MAYRMEKPHTSHDYPKSLMGFSLEGAIDTLVTPTNDSGNQPAYAQNLGSNKFSFS